MWHGLLLRMLQLSLALIKKLFSRFYITVIQIFLNAHTIPFKNNSENTSTNKVTLLRKKILLTFF